MSSNSVDAQRTNGKSKTNQPAHGQAGNAGEEDDSRQSGSANIPIVTNSNKAGAIQSYLSNNTQYSADPNLAAKEKTLLANSLNTFTPGQLNLLFQSRTAYKFSSTVANSAASIIPGQAGGEDTPMAGLDSSGALKDGTLGLTTSFAGSSPRVTIDENAINCFPK